MNKLLERAFILVQKSPISTKLSDILQKLFNFCSKSVKSVTKIIKPTIISPNLLQKLSKYNYYNYLKSHQSLNEIIGSSTKIIKVFIKPLDHL